MPSLEVKGDMSSLGVGGCNGKDDKNSQLGQNHGLFFIHLSLSKIGGV